MNRRGFLKTLSTLAIAIALPLNLTRFGADEEALATTWSADEIYVWSLLTDETAWFLMDESRVAWRQGCVVVWNGRLRA